MNRCTVCASANLNKFDADGDQVLWCEDCGALHQKYVDGTGWRTWRPEKSMLHHQVLAFHNRFGQSIGEKPHVPDEKTVRFRLSLIAEEFCELFEAAGVGKGGSAWDRIREYINEDTPNVDLPAFVDALADLDYVIEGCRITFGVDGAPIAAEVQRANMAKLPSYVAAKDASHGKVFTHHVCKLCGARDDAFGVYETCSVSGPQHEWLPAMHLPEPVKREDGKIMKPPGWTPPDIEGELKKQGWEP